MINLLPFKNMQKMISSLYVRIINFYYYPQKIITMKMDIQGKGKVYYRFSEGQELYIGFN